MIGDLPVLDAHVHLDPHGSPKDAVSRFLKKGGSHLIIIHKPYHHLQVNDLEGYRKTFDTTFKMCKLANDEGCRSWCFVGPYPGELPYLAERIGFDEAVDLQFKAVELALKYVEEGKALGIGEVGRIHFPVEEKFQIACDGLLNEIFEGAAERTCPVVLHTESYYTNPNLMEHLASLIDRTSLPRYRAVKHYSGPDLIEPKDNLGISLSLQCRKETLRSVLSGEEDHLWETDYIDDPKRPNVVMPPDTVPKKIAWARAQGILDNERHAKMMIDLPKKVLGIDTQL
jgi:TatD-related deoxyribonuclease